MSFWKVLSGIMIARISPTLKARRPRLRCQSRKSKIATYNLHGSALNTSLLTFHRYMFCPNFKTRCTLCPPGNICLAGARRLSNTFRYQRPNSTEHLTNDTGGAVLVYMDYPLPVANCCRKDLMPHFVRFYQNLSCARCPADGRITSAS